MKYRKFKHLSSYCFIKNNLIAFVMATFLLAGCGGGSTDNTDNTQPNNNLPTENTVELPKTDFKSGYLTDSRIFGGRYTQGSKIGYTALDGAFQYDALNPEKIEFSVGGIVLGSVTPSDMENNNSTVYPADLVGVDRNDTNNSKVTNILQVLQSLDSDGNPFNGIEITTSTHAALKDENISLVKDDVNQSKLGEIVAKDTNKTLIPVNDAIAHYEDTLRKDLNLTVDTVAPAPAKIEGLLYTNQKSKILTIYGEKDAKVSINGNMIYDSVIGSNNQLNVAFDTSGSDGDKNFTIVLQDSSDKNSSDTNITIVKDATAPTLNVGTSIVKFDENTPITTTIFDANATDVHSVTFGINGTGAAYFNINASSGVVTFKTSPDYETKESYDFNITATDIVGNLATQTVKVNINHLNDIAPVFTTNTLLAVEENNATITTLSSTDADIDEKIPTFTYSIVGGVDSNKLQLNDAALSFKNAPDFDYPTDVNKDNQYVVDINVTDGLNSTTKTFTVAVTPANDNAPILVGASNKSFNENYTGNVLDLNHTDADSIKPGMVQVFAYSISGTDASYFNINSVTGVITFNSAPDYETKKSYSITAKVNDGKWDSTIANIMINILPQNDISPVITSANSVTFNENATGTVLTLTSSDADQNQTQTFTYSIAGTDASSFNIDTTTGVITFIAAPDYETKKSYNITATVSDGENTSTAQNIVITVGHLNDVTPIITSNDVSLGENIMNVMTITSTDGDLDENQTFIYSIDGGKDADDFNITTNGVLSFKEEPDYENPTDNGKNNIYEVGVKVNDGVNPSIVKTLNITVTPRNDIKPIITSIDTNVSENIIDIMTITSTDADQNQSDQVFEYSIDGGADRDDFNITTNGNLSFKVKPDYEMPTDDNNDSVYEVSVRVFDGVNYSIPKTLKIGVTPLNDIAPVIIVNDTPNILENFNSIVLDINHTDGDRDQNQTFVYSLGGDDANYFDINETNGTVTFINPPDYETKQSYNLIASVSDGVFDVNQTIVLNIIHTNDETPVVQIIKGTISQNFVGNIFTLSQTDRDIDENQTFTYDINGTDKNSFEANASTGVVAIAPTTARKNSYEFIANVNDGINTGSANIYITFSEGMRPATTENQEYNVTANLTIGNVTETIVFSEFVPFSQTLRDEAEVKSIKNLFSTWDGRYLRSFTYSPNWNSGDQYIITYSEPQRFATALDSRYDITITISKGSYSDSIKVQEIVPTTNLVMSLMNGTVAFVNENFRNDFNVTNGVLFNNKNNLNKFIGSAFYVNPSMLSSSSPISTSQGLFEYIKSHSSGVSLTSISQKNYSDGSFSTRYELTSSNKSLFNILEILLGSVNQQIYGINFNNYAAISNVILDFYVEYKSINEAYILVSLSDKTISVDNEIIKIINKDSIVESSEKLLDNKETFTYNTSRPLGDFVFVMDDSGSMSEEQSAAIEAINRTFSASITKYNLDWKATTIGTENSRSYTANVGNPAINDLSKLTSQLNIGLNGGDERGVYKAYQYIQNGSIGIRNNSSLTVIYVSDEPCHTLLSQIGSPTTDLSNSYFVQNDIRFNTIMPTNYQNSSDVAYRMTLATGGDSANLYNYASGYDQMMDLAVRYAVAKNSSVKLQYPALASSITVQVNEIKNNNWEYDPTERAIVFPYSVQPNQDDNITVTYSHLDFEQYVTSAKAEFDDLNISAKRGYTNGDITVTFDPASLKTPLADANQTYDVTVTFSMYGYSATSTFSESVTSYLDSALAEFEALADSVKRSYTNSNITITFDPATKKIPLADANQTYDVDVTFSKDGYERILTFSETVEAAAFSVTSNSLATPWLQSGNTFTSQNHSNSSSSSIFMNILRDTTINYSVSSEGCYDKLSIAKNSGSYANYCNGSYGTITFKAGDTVEFKYSKDGSSSYGTDTATITFQ